MYGEFTLRETLLYFGWIAGMTTSEVDEKIDFLMQLLQLPNVTRFVKNLSGGQQRRMSLAAALLHGMSNILSITPIILFQFLFLEKLQYQIPNTNNHLKNSVNGLISFIRYYSITEPELLILDEPTVGVDPIIRNSIWNHLVDITNTSKKTVIITTHYIEETRQAHVVSKIHLFVIYHEISLKLCHHNDVKESMI